MRYLYISSSYPKDLLEKNLFLKGYKVDTMNSEFYKKDIIPGKVRVLISKITKEIIVEKTSSWDYLKKWKRCRPKNKYIKELKSLMRGPKDIISYILL